MSKYKLFNGDCLEVMKLLISKNIKVDTIITDPPYIINYADWDKEFNMPLAIDLCYELLKDNGNLILFQGWSNVCKTKELLDKKFTIQNWIIWDRIKGRGAKKNLVSTREDILWYCKGNEPTYTKIYSNIPKKTGGLGKKNGQENRALTNRERARLQTFPDEYIFEGSKESVRKQIGMAVPCEGAKIIFEAILKTFAGIPYESIEANIKE